MTQDMIKRVNKESEKASTSYRAINVEVAAKFD